MIEELASVVLATDVLERGLRTGDIGTVVMVHQRGQGYRLLRGMQEGYAILRVKQWRNSLMASSMRQYRDQVLAEIDAVPAEYLPLLLQLMRTFRETITLKPAAASFQQGWQEAQRGELAPVAELWEGGETPGDRIAGVAYRVFKVRIKNSDIAKGKSGGYRVIYYQLRHDAVVLVTMYSKTEQGDIAADEIRRIITAHDIDEKQI